MEKGGNDLKQMLLFRDCADCLRQLDTDLAGEFAKCLVGYFFYDEPLESKNPNVNAMLNLVRVRLETSKQKALAGSKGGKAGSGDAKKRDGLEAINEQRKQNASKPQALTQADTQALTQADTQALTQADTQALTQADTQALTQAKTQKPRKYRKRDKKEPNFEERDYDFDELEQRFAKNLGSAKNA